MKVCELVLDYDLYPRLQVSSHHVSDLREAIRAGEQLPPVVVDRKTNRVVDGFHRTKAYLAEHGPDHDIEVDARDYKSDASLFADCMRLNSRHGRGLTPADKTRCLIKAKKFRLGAKAIASYLGVSTATLKAMAEGRIAKTDSHEDIPLKQTIRHKSGQQLTKPQVEANSRLSGMNQVFYVNQLLLLLENDLIDRSDEKLMEGLGKLSAAIASFASGQVTQEHQGSLAEV